MALRLTTGTPSEDSSNILHLHLPAGDKDESSVVHSSVLGVIVLEIFRLVKISLKINTSDMERTDQKYIS